MGSYLFLWADNLACISRPLADTSLVFLGTIPTWTPPVIAGRQLHLSYLQGYDDQYSLRTNSSKFNSNHSLLCQHVDQSAHFHFENISNCCLIKSPDGRAFSFPSSVNNKYMLLLLSLLESSGASRLEKILFSFSHIQLKIKFLCVCCYYDQDFNATRGVSVCRVFRLDCLYQSETLAIIGHVRSWTQKDQKKKKKCQWP